MGTNRITRIRTTELESDAGPMVAIFLSLECGDTDTADSFCSEVAEVFKAHRMCSPPNTSVLLVTLIGHLTASHFARRWREIAEGDPVLRHDLSLMRMADVVHGTADGEVLETVSLSPNGSTG
jgi:hypothetical protein